MPVALTQEPGAPSPDDWGAGLTVVVTNAKSDDLTTRPMHFPLSCIAQKEDDKRAGHFYTGGVVVAARGDGDLRKALDAPRLLFVLLETGRASPPPLPPKLSRPVSFFCGSRR